MNISGFVFRETVYKIYDEYIFVDIKAEKRTKRLSGKALAY